MNVDIGGGTTKIAVCEDGAVVEQSALDVGARILSFDGLGRVQRIEEAGLRLAAEVGLVLAIGSVPDAAGLQALVERMAERLFEALQGGNAVSAATAALLRLAPLSGTRPADVLCFSGGVSEYLYGRSTQAHGDLGPALASAVMRRVQTWGPRIATPDQGIRATVVGASQYTVQVSGSTVFVQPQSVLPLRNLAVVTPALPLGDECIEVQAIAAAVQAALHGMDLQHSESAVALCYRWQGSASHARLDAFCRGVIAGLAPLLERGLPLVLVGDGDIGGLVGIHAHSELKLANAVVSIDGIVLHAFDFIDIGALLETSGAVPVVIKSLVFPPSAALGRDAAPRA